MFKKTRFWGATARRAKAPAGKGVLFALSTSFSKAKEKKTKAADQKEVKRQKRIAELEAQAEKRTPHQTGAALSPSLLGRTPPRATPASPFVGAAVGGGDMAFWNAVSSVPANAGSTANAPGRPETFAAAPPSRA